MFTQQKVQDLTFTIYRNSAWSNVIRAIVEIRGTSSTVYERIIPRNTPEILINLGNPISANFNEKELLLKKFAIQGSKTSWINVHHPSHSHFISIQFNPNGIYKFLGLPQVRFTNKFYQLNNVLNGAENLRSHLRESKTVQERFSHLSRWINKRISDKSQTCDLLSDHIINCLHNKPHTSVKELASNIGYTRKHLSQRFKKEVGLKIKEYQVIHRLRWTLNDINDDKHIRWPAIAGSHGYFDQSHFIKSFKRYTGFTPADYRKRCDPTDRNQLIF